MKNRGFLGSLLSSAPVPYTGSGGRLSIDLLKRPQGGTTAQLEAMGSVGTLFQIVHRLSNAVSQVDWKLYRKSKSGKDEDRVEVTRHLALDIWNKPNKFYTRQEFVESFQQHVELTGESEWLIERHPGFDIPLGLWPIRPDKMTPVPHPTEFLSGWVFSGPDGEKVPLELNEVIQLRMPNPLDPYRGMGPVQALMTDIDSAKYSAEWNRNFFLNNAEPGGIISVDESLSDTDFDQMRDRWNEQHRGVGKAHRIAILEHGKYENRSFSMRDMQFAELRQVSRDVMMEAYGMGKPMLGITEDVNRANAEAAELVFARYLMVPRLERVKGALNNDFLPMFGVTGEGLEFDYEDVVPEDREAESTELTARANATATLISAGFTAADVLLAVGLPEMEFVKKAPPPQFAPQQPPQGGPDPVPADPQGSEQDAQQA